MLFNKKSGGYEYIIVGLGNPGAKYEMTRHNAGFLAADLLAIKNDTDIKKLKFHALIGDISLDVGKIRIRRKGSAGGHNGLKSINAHLSSENYPRIKVGVGKKPNAYMDLADWVLGRFPKELESELRTALENACAAAELIVCGDTDRAMNLYN